MGLVRFHFVVAYPLVAQLTFGAVALPSLHADSCDSFDDAAVGVPPAHHIRQVIRDFPDGCHASPRVLRPLKCSPEKLLLLGSICDLSLHTKKAPAVN